MKSPRPASRKGTFVSGLATVISIGAGIYMLTTHAQASNSIFNPFLHGIGAYFVARGLWMGVAWGRRSDALELLERVVAVLEGDVDSEELPADDD
jgi:hypothetical protein